ncbi:MAG: PD-(D/E)XK nuclease family protein [Clostridia bacterium]|nr:PD-(D/E)XK nuclease family protein [Clostridia bacterium]
MVNFIIGRAGSGKSTALCEMIKNEIANGGRQVVLLVPEQQAVVWETKMASVLPASANLRLEITNFTRLSNSVFREGGGLVDTVIDEGSRSLLVWRAMLSVWEHLRVYNRDHEDRCIPHLMNAIDELKSSGVTPIEAEAALDELRLQRGETDGKGVGDLLSRLSDAVMVYAAYEDILHEEYIDRGDLLANLALALDKCEYFRGKAVFVDSFFSLTAPEERILYRIMSQADEVTLTFACPPDIAESRREIQFGEVREYLKNVTSMASRLGLEINRVELTQNLRHKNSPTLSAVEKHLFNYTSPMPAPVCDEGEGDVKIIKCTDRFDEAEACAAIIEKLHREGYRNSDIAVVAGNMTSREGVLDTVLRRHGINCFMSEPGSVSTSPAVRLVLSALGVAVGGWQRKNIIRLLKTGMTPVGRDADEIIGKFEGDIFETYTGTWNIHGRRMYTGDDWCMNPDGYKTEISKSAEVMLKWANSVKNKLIPPLDRPLSVFDGGVANVRDIAVGIVNFAEEYGVQHSLREIAGSYRAIGMTADAKKAESSWQSVCEILDKMVNMLGETRLDASRFAGLFARVASAMDVSTIPTGIDEVVLGSATGVRFDRVRCVIMLGSVDGEFPGSVRDGGSFFDDGDKTVLESVGLALDSLDVDMRTAREYFMYYRTAASPTDKLYILAPTDGGDLSEGALRIQAITDSTTSFAAMPLSEVVYSRAGAEYQLSRRTDLSEIALLTSLVGETAGADVPLTAENDVIADLGGNEVRRMSLSQTRIDTFVQCPFNYSCKYLMKIKPEAKAEIRTPDIGTFMHHVMERFFSGMSAEQLVSDNISEEALREMSDDIIREYLAELSEGSGTAYGSEHDGRIEYLFIRLSRYVPVFLRAVLREIGQSRFKPVAFELPMGIDGEGGVPPITFETEDGTEVTLRGIADRIDMYEEGGKKYLRVVDYKTGAKSFSMDNVSRGIDVQLLIYLFTVWKRGIPSLGITGDVVPAGAVYFSARPTAHPSDTMLTPDEAAELSIDKIERSGIYLADEDVLRAMDGELGGKYVAVKVSGEEIKSSKKSTTLLSLDEFGSLYTELEKILCGIATEMKCGKAEAKPESVGGKSPCEWCDNRYICKISQEKGEA